MAKLIFLAIVVVVGLFAATTSVVMAADADPINDFCVADLASPILINGLACKNPANVTGADFAFAGFKKAGDTNNPLGIAVTPGFAGVNYPGLNTQGLAMARLDFAKGGLVPPHTHPRATEVLYLVEGELYVGFVDTNNKLFAGVMKKGDVYVFPRGLVHFQFNIGKKAAFSISTLNGQNPGVQLIASSLFGAQPTIPDAVLAKTFGVTVAAVEAVKKGFGA